MLLKKRIHFFSLVLVSAVVFLTHAASAQRLQVPQASQKASVMQRLGLSEISVTYSRPPVKGRTVYGDWPTVVEGEATLDNQNTRPKGAPLVPWGHIWRAGANDATLFVVNDDVLINGQPLPAGRYSFHTIPSKDGDWTLIFNKDDGQWGSFNYEAGKDALRVKTKAEPAADSQELLTYTIDPLGPDSAIVRLRWEKLTVPFTVQVKDVEGKALARLRGIVPAAKADDWATPLSAAGYAKSVKAMDDASKWLDQAVKAIDEVIKTKPTFANLRQKTSILINGNRMAEAFAVADKAIEAGKAEKADTTQFEKRIADLKAAKP